MTTAQQALADRNICAQATQVQFFSRCTIYEFADGSRLTVNMYSPSHAD